MIKQLNTLRYGRKIYTRIQYNLSIIIILFVSLFTAPGFAKGEIKQLNVYVTLADQETGNRQAIKELISIARHNLNKTREEFNKRYGKNRNKWDPNTEFELYKKSEPYFHNYSRLLNLKTKMKHKNKSVTHLLKNFAGKGLVSRKKKHINVVHSRNKADLIIEIVGRTGGISLFRGNKALCVNLLAGPKVNPQVLSKIPMEWPYSNFKGRAWRGHSYRPDAPYLQLYMHNTERWYDVANWMTVLIDDLSKNYYELIKTDHAN